jgi:hypothetical protein
MTGAAQHPREALTLGKAKAQTQKHFPGVEQPHGLGRLMDASVRSAIVRMMVFGEQQQ